jgi:hypothetical protein
MFRRADRALLQAKEQGRNQVVQLGDGMVEKETKKKWWPFHGGPRGSTGNPSLIDCELVTVVPIEIVAQKLRGFIADHAAKVTSTGEDHLFLEIAGDKAGKFRRDDDRPIPFSMEMRFVEERSGAPGIAGGDTLQTRVHVIVRPKKERDRRREQTSHRARHLLISLKSYLMAKEPSDPSESHPELNVGELQVVASGE